MAQQEKFEFHYTFQGTEFGNGICSFHSIFFTVFCPRKPFCAPCVLLPQAVQKLVLFARAKTALAWLLLANGPVVGRRILAGRGE